MCTVVHLRFQRALSVQRSGRGTADDVTGWAPAMPMALETMTSLAHHAHASWCGGGAGVPGTYHPYGCVAEVGVRMHPGWGGGMRACQALTIFMGAWLRSGSVTGVSSLSIT